jgi:hypothetical protein
MVIRRGSGPKSCPRKDDDDNLIMFVAVAARLIKYRSVSRKRSVFYKTVDSPFQLEIISSEDFLLLLRFKHSHILLIRSFLFTEAEFVL